MLLTVSATTIISLAFADIPEELKAAANQLSFLADEARRCDSVFAVHGKAGLRSKAYSDFQRKALPVFKKLSNVGDLGRNAAAEADTTTSMETKWRWMFFFRQFEADQDAVFKALDPLKSLEKYHARWEATVGP